MAASPSYCWGSFSSCVCVERGGVLRVWCAALLPRRLLHFRLFPDRHSTSESTSSPQGPPRPKVAHAADLALGLGSRVILHIAPYLCWA